MKFRWLFPQFWKKIPIFKTNLFFLKIGIVFVFLKKGIFIHSPPTQATIYYHWSYFSFNFIYGKSICNTVFLQGQNFLGVIDDPLFENLGVIGKFRGSELF